MSTTIINGTATSAFWSCVPTTSTAIQTVWTTTYVTELVAACPTSMWTATYTIEETCTGNPANYLPPPIPAGFVVTTVTCDSCGPSSEIVITCPGAQPTGVPPTVVIQGNGVTADITPTVTVTAAAPGGGNGGAGGANPTGAPGGKGNGSGANGSGSGPNGSGANGGGNGAGSNPGSSGSGSGSGSSNPQGSDMGDMGSGNTGSGSGSGTGSSGPMGMSGANAAGNGTSSSGSNGTSSSMPIPVTAGAASFRSVLAASGLAVIAIVPLLAL
ncbi:hypothetical protein PFICI_07436 [Pestalotiopsis fici W106-1]|uniref:Uncharacterized protein n=1 Tax=Pestalotiopsis fici (strain W106-1 / CGMCC3.15140) TaxID=1229662 RepID=W3X3D6_PESFW|nr:uncharacterized protein PFICI_07436 [Pestalotiopsis fici W106-1]ETS79907.1 hypothetical protein PFICI_07436 [Pestalotiopsis fici W106-1]